MIGGGIVFAQSSQGVCKVCSAGAIVTGPVFSFYLPAIVMLCIYIKSFLVAQRQVHNIRSTSTAVNKMEKKATKTLATVMGVFLCCMLPCFLYLSFQLLTDQHPLNWLDLSNSMLNPFIYAFFLQLVQESFQDDYF
ncbi:unnamed protein product [Tetraodon nigroviridis]|uniref:(spotted green pufferfish) hypothetical protein n=1 Tax=Tetraodon nigroviridis TaxID=99883 RepID=Q4RF30_TETNG|nr:unnamed protein product [Tetraodon nigroviridis]